MSKVRKRLLAALLAMAMILSLCTGITARAEGEATGGDIKIYRPNFEGDTPVAPTSKEDLLWTSVVGAKGNDVFYFESK